MNAPQQPKLRLRDRRRRLLWVKVAAGTGVAAVSLALFWYVVRLPEVTIAEVSVEGAVLAQADVLKQLSEAALQGSYGFFIPRNSAFLIPRQNIAAAIESAFPQIESVSVEREGWQRLVVSVTERTPTALWCLPAQAGTQDEDTVSCYLMNENGFIFEKAAGGEEYVEYYGVLSEEPVGKTFLAGGFPSLSTFVEAIAQAANR